MIKKKPRSPCVIGVDIVEAGIGAGVGQKNQAFVEAQARQQVTGTPPRWVRDSRVRVSPRLRHTTHLHTRAQAKNSTAPVLMS